MTDPDKMEVLEYNVNYYKQSLNEYGFRIDRLEQNGQLSPSASLQAALLTYLAASQNLQSEILFEILKELQSQNPQNKP